MNSGTPSSSALAQTGWNLGSENSTARSPATDRRALQALLLDRRLELRDGEIRRLQGERGEGREPVGLAGAELGQLLVLDLDDLAGEVALLPYQKGLIDSTSMSTACASIASSRLSISMKASSAPLTGGTWIAGASAPSSAPASRKWQCEWTSIVFTRLPLTLMGSERGTGLLGVRRLRSPQPQKTMPVAAALLALRKSRRVFMGRLPPVSVFLCGDGGLVFGSPAMRLCHMTRGWVMSHGVA